MLSITDSVCMSLEKSTAPLKLASLATPLCANVKTGFISWGPGGGGGGAGGGLPR